MELSGAVSGWFCGSASASGFSGVCGVRDLRRPRCQKLLSAVGAELCVLANFSSAVGAIHRVAP